MELAVQPTPFADHDAAASPVRFGLTDAEPVSARYWPVEDIVRAFRRGGVYAVKLIGKSLYSNNPFVLVHKEVPITRK